jgi:hypothetical protein
MYLLHSTKRQLFTAPLLNSSLPVWSTICCRSCNHKQERNQGPIHYITSLVASGNIDPTIISGCIHLDCGTLSGYNVYWSRQGQQFVLSQRLLRVGMSVEIFREQKMLKLWALNGRRVSLMTVLSLEADAVQGRWRRRRYSDHVLSKKEGVW